MSTFQHSVLWPNTSCSQMGLGRMSLHQELWEYKPAWDPHPAVELAWKQERQRGLEWKGPRRQLQSSLASVPSECVHTRTSGGTGAEDRTPWEISEAPILYCSVYWIQLPGSREPLQVHGKWPPALPWRALCRAPGKCPGLCTLPVASPHLYV